MPATVAPIKKHQDSRARLVSKMRALSKKASDEDRDLTDQEQNDYQAMETQLTGVSAAITREQRLMDEERALSGGAQEGNDEPEETTPAMRPHKKVFANFGQQLQAVIRAGMPDGVVDPRLREVAAGSGLSEGVPADGGFLVQPDFAADLLRRTYELGQITSRVTTLPVSGSGLKINGIDETSRANGSRYGGVQVFWVDEAGTVTPKKPKFRQLELDLKKLMGIAYLTDELVQDAPALQGFTSLVFAEEFNFKIEDACVSGTGAGQPLGIMNSPSLVTVLKEGGQAAGTLQKENLFKMWSRCWGRSRQNAIWLINQDVEPALFGILLGQTGIYFPAGTFANQPFGTLFGRPVIPVEYCSTLGTTGDIILADFSQYLMIDKGGLQSATSIHVRFLNDEMTLRFTYRVDGEPTWHSVLTPYKGANTLSPFVVVETR